MQHFQGISKLSRKGDCITKSLVRLETPATPLTPSRPESTLSPYDNATSPQHKHLQQGSRAPWLRNYQPSEVTQIRGVGSGANSILHATSCTWV